MTSAPKDHPRFVVAFGASAGGVDPLREILASLPPRLDAAFVIVQHLEPGSGEVAREVIAAAGRRRTILIDRPTALQSNCIYVVPPRSILSTRSGRYTARPARNPSERLTEIDHALRTLAKSLEDRLIAVLLSGEGEDGSAGFAAVKEHGGTTLVQSPASARHPAMLETALSRDVVDHAKGPAEIAALLTTRVTGSSPPAHPPGGAAATERIRAAIGPICEALRRHTSHDFKYYKISAVTRRIRRRMQVLRVESVDAYSDRLQNDGAEAEALFRELLINVTSFFRDADAFRYLDETVIGPALAQSPPDAKFRVWVPGCSTGEEVYSLAIIIRERLDTLKIPPMVQILATDIDERALSFARKGCYPLSIDKAVGKARLKRFFTRVGDTYQVDKQLRDMCLFSSHNLVSDPPFSRVDLISCRNVLIYIGEALQNKLISLFHFALKPGGHLFLGSSESLVTHENLFYVLSDSFRVARRRAVAAPAPHWAGRSESGVAPVDVPRLSDADIQQISQRIIFNEFSPRYVVVNGEGTIVTVSARIAEFLDPSEGSFSNNLFRLVPSEMRSPLRAGLKHSARDRTRVRVRAPRRGPRGVQTVQVNIEPLPRLGDDRDLFMFVFGAGGEDSTEGARDPVAVDVNYVDRIESELLQARQDLDRSVQDLEASNEELKSSNEELLSMNEELQSANEELEASKEEIQKANFALQSANRDLENLLASTRIATLFLDRDLNIRGFTPAVTEIYNIRDSDVGRPLSDLTVRAVDALPVQPGLAEIEIRMPDDRVYLRRTLPYVVNGQREDGLVVTFVDVTELRRSERRFRTLIQATEQMVWVCDVEGRIIEDSPSWRAYTGQTLEEWLGYGWLNAVHPDDRARSLEVWRDSVARSVPYDVDYRLKHISGQWRWTRARGIPVLNPEGAPTGWIGINTDVNERKTQQLNYERNVDASPAILWITERDGTCSYLSKQWTEFTGQTTADGLGLGWAEMVHPDDAPGAAASFLEASGARQVYYREFRVRSRTGGYRWVIDAGNPRYDYDGTYLGMAGTVFDIHERILADEARSESERAMRESEAKFRTITDAMPEMVWSCAPDGTPEYFNQRWFQFSGLKPSTETLEWAELVHPNEREAVRTAWRHSLNTGEPFQHEFRLRNGSNKFRWVLSRALPVRETDGTITRWLGTSTDVHDRRVVAEALSLSEERYRMITEISPQLMWASDRSGAVNFVNTSWVDYTGLSFAQSMGDGWFAAVRADRRADVRELISRAIHTLTPFEVDVPIGNRDGEYRWFLAKGLPVRDHRGQFDRWVGVAVDIHERKTARDRIEANEAILKTITDNTTSSLFMMDQRGHPTFMNPAAEKLTGYKLNEITDRPLHYSIHYRRPDGSHYPMEECPIDNAQSELTHLQDQQETFVDKNGRIFPVSFSVAPLQREGRTTGSILEFRDIEAQREIEDQLRAAKDAAVEANEAKSTFLANMSHEIRTPLGAIVGFSDLLNGQVEANSEAAAYVSRISRNSAQLSQLIDELLDLSKIEAKRLVVEQTSVALAEMIDDVVAAVGLQARDKRVELSVTKDAAAPQTLFTDPTRFKQILINLVGNAIKFSEGGRTTVDVRTNAGLIEIRVIDTGIGLNEDQRQNLFRPFTQADSSITRKYGGTGLGLALSRDLARLLGGDVTLERSAPGDGSTFMLTLPMSTALIVKSGPREDAPPEIERLLAGRSILVVDDSPDNQFLVSHLLERSGAVLDQASDGLEAVEKADLHTYDVILMDLQMPRMDGYSALRTLREACYQRPVVALTAHALKSERDRCFASGFDAYVTKPVDRAILLRTIRDLLV